MYSTTGAVQDTSSTVVQLLSVPDGVLDAQSEFYCCARCGKVFWQGSHWDKVIKKN